MQHKSKLTFLASMCLAGSMLSTPILAHALYQDTQADNTKVNTRDRNQNQPTADQGKNNMSDVQLQAKIRREVVKDKSLSTYGHNVKIIASHGQVTLKGPVHSEDEKRAIEEHARKYAGDGKVTDEITVKGDSK
jgi:osmotically-inducible protein OsmY